MSVYAIGDVQGCYDALQHLLDRIAFNLDEDTLWFAGDLVNRGPQSLAVLRFVRELGSRAITVLGNHDLTLLAVATGFVKPKRKDTLDEILEAPDCDELLHWLRHCPIMHHDPSLNFTLVHAGLAPQWTLTEALACATELQEALRGPDYRDFLAQMFGQEPRRWDAELSGIERLRCITNHFTRMRFCSAEGELSFNEKGPPGSQSENLLPWFDVPGRNNADLNIVFGHWAALGTYHQTGIYALDSGCVWGGQLSALSLDQGSQPTLFSVPCHTHHH